MYDRSGLNLPTCYSSQTVCPPWRYTQIPVELFDLIAAPTCTSVRLYRLHYEILQFYHFMISTEEENAIRQQVIHRICAVIHQHLPTASVDIYGSYKTRLNLPQSDIDLIVYSADGRQWNAGELAEIMSELRDAFCHSQICTQEGIRVLSCATVPIIKLTDHQTDVRVDMSFNMNGGPRSTQLILHYLQAYPYLKYLFYVLKQYLFQLDLNTVWTGGISSYSLILMLVCFFQTYYKKNQDSLGPPPSSSSSSSPSSSSSSALLSLSTSSSSTMKSFSTSSIKASHSIAGTTDDCSSSVSYPSSSAASCVSSDDHINCSIHSSDNDDDHLTSRRNYHPSNVPLDHVNLGHMLISFLQLYGVYFDYAKLGIRIQKPNQADSSAGFINKDELFKKFCCGHRTMTNLCIVDPFNDKNDIGKATWLIPKLQIAFREAYDTLAQSVSNRKRASTNAPPILSKILTVNERILAFREQLHRIYSEHQNDQRSKQMQYGRSINGLSDKILIEYPNRMSPRYAYLGPYQQPFLHQIQSLRTNLPK